MLTVTAPSNIPTTVFNITTYGAVADGSTDNTTAIQNAINAANAAHGGVVEFPAAAKAYECGPLTLCGNIDYQFDSGSELQALPYGTYPNTGSSSIKNFLSASNISNFEITGSGVIDGNGSPWWTAYNANNSLVRPRLINISGCNIFLMQNVTLQNSATFHLAFGSTNNVTINTVTISAPSTSPNTDGIDPAGQHYLIENCNISTGDDNIAVKPETVFCGDITVTGCTFGYGHGMSIGGETNDGLNGMTVSNCTFTNTTSGLRFKAYRGYGGLVENVTYTNLTMTNVEYPININSYYNLGSVPTNPQDPAQPVTSTTPFWQDITISNITITNPPSSSYAGIIWGLPEAPVTDVTLSNVKTSGVYGFDLDHVRNVNFDSQCTITVTGGGSKFISTKSVSTPFDALYFVDQDINSPAVAGNASYDLSSGNFTLNGGGADIGSTASDQFNFDSTILTGDGTLVAEVNSQTATDPSAKAGVMVRASTSSSSSFAAVLATPGGSILFLWRNGTTLGSASVTGQPSPSWVKLVRSGNNFSAYYGSSSASTSLGTTQTISMTNSVLAGLAVTSHTNSSTAALNTAVFSNVEIFSVLSSAGALPNPVTGTTSQLLVFAADVLADSGTTYTWSATTVPNGATLPTYTPNSSNAALATTVTFHEAGNYVFLVTIQSASGLVLTSTTTTVTVSQVLTNISVSPTAASLIDTQTQAFSATANDQFNYAMSTQPTFTWTVESGGVGTVNSAGVYTAPNSGTGTATVQATSSSVSGIAAVTVQSNQLAGTSGNDVIRLARSGALLNVYINNTTTPAYSFTYSTLGSIGIAAGAGNDTVQVDFSPGSTPVPTGGLTVDGGTGTADALIITGTTGNDTAMVSASTITFDSSVITYQNEEAITVNTDGGDDTLTQSAQPGNGASLVFNSDANDTLNVNAGTYTIAAPAPLAGIVVNTLGTLNIASGTTVQLDSSTTEISDRTLLVLGTLSLAGSTGDWTGKLDLGSNDMLLKSGITTKMNDQLHEGFNNGSWNGSGGILSSSAATAVAAGNYLTAIGYEKNDDGSGTNTPLVTTFDGQPTIDGDILVKYTYFGDADLSGAVNASDYTLVDTGFNSDYTGWHNGDFNYDGVVDGDDYTLLDNAMNSQGYPFSATSLVSKLDLQKPSAVAIVDLAEVAEAKLKSAVQQSFLPDSVFNAQSQPIASSWQSQPQIDDLFQSWTA